MFSSASTYTTRSTGPGFLAKPKSLLEHTVFQFLISVFQHFCSVFFLVVCVTVMHYVFPTGEDQSRMTPVEWYGYTGCVVLYFLRFIPYFSVPFAVTNILGLVTMKLWPVVPKLQVPRTNIPFFCFRVVTRGLYPELVRYNVQRNIEVCYKVGLDNFKFEVVTDKPLNLPISALIRELIVPTEYVTHKNSLFKARALHYCLESDVNILSDDDWIVHLDEETVLTEGSVIGLANFAGQELGMIGQGVITYANEEIVNWWTTLADSVRVSVDLGMIRFSLKKLNCPAMGFKGSYIVVKQLVEKDIGFDFGPIGSIAEDIFFALMAWKKGYKFDFVEGEMWEKSPFTLMDYLKQRKRWFLGHMNMLLSPEIPLRYKLGILPTDLGWLLLLGNITNFYTSVLFPVPVPKIHDFIIVSLSGLILFLFVFGSIKSFSVRKYGLFKKLLICLWTVTVIPLAAGMDAIAPIYGLLTIRSGGFHVVQKEIEPPAASNNDEIV